MASLCYAQVEQYSILHGLARTVLLTLANNADDYGWGETHHPVIYMSSINRLFRELCAERPELQEAGLTDVHLPEVRRSIEYAVEMGELFWDTPKGTYKINVDLPDVPKMERMPDPGFIYILESEYGFKVGKTRDLPSRMNFFGVKLPFETGLVHVIPSSNITRAETALHGVFAHRRLKGEWFDLGERELAFLCETSSLEPIR